MLKVWLNDNEVGMHRGGYDAFSFDITEYIEPGSIQSLIYFSLKLLTL